MAGPTEAMLREALEHLAADAEAQTIYLRQLGTWPSLDELALELDDVAEVPGAWGSPTLRARVRLLSRKLDEMSGEQNATHWQPEALHEPEWAEVRRLAAEALAAFE